MAEQDNIVTPTHSEGIANLIARLRKEESRCASVYIIDAAIETIERLTAERDEARRMWCESAPVGNSLSVNDMDRRARAEATRRGWDCFKENTNG